jgi:hypothetical protein
MLSKAESLPHIHLTSAIVRYSPSQESFPPLPYEDLLSRTVDLQGKGKETADWL